MAAATKRKQEDTATGLKAAPASNEDRSDRRMDRLARISERAIVRAKREAALVPASEQPDRERTAGDRFFDPDEFAGNNRDTEVSDPDVGWLPLDGRPR